MLPLDFLGHIDMLVRRMIRLVGGRLVVRVPRIISLLSAFPTAGSDKLTIPIQLRRIALVGFISAARR